MVLHITSLTNCRNEVYICVKPAPMAESSGKYEDAKTFAEMLRNTSSNIRRLADEIQQCEGRQKYLAQTGSPSDGGDVRWYFSKVPMAETGEF